MVFICPKCKRETSELTSEPAFCPFCGHKNEVYNDMTTAKKIRIYLVSFFLVPFGLIWFFKYFKSSDKIKRKVGYQALIITIVALLLSFSVILLYIKALNKYTQMYKSDLDFIMDSL